MNYIIRLAQKSDCDELSKLKHAVWNSTYRGIYSDEKIDNFDYKENSDKFLDLINSSKVNLFVVQDKDSLVGYMTCGALHKSYNNYSHGIGLLYVSEEYQGKGIGKRLFLLGKEKLKEKGFEEFIVYCNKYNTNAQEFYKKMGGKIINIDEDGYDKSKSQVVFLYKIK